MELKQKWYLWVAAVDQHDLIVIISLEVPPYEYFNTKGVINEVCSILFLCITTRPPFTTNTLQAEEYKLALVLTQVAERKS